LSKAVKRLIWKAIRGPVLTHASKIVVEAAILLSEYDDVIDLAYARISGSRGSPKTPAPTQERDQQTDDE